MSTKIPATVITGFLGAGKTSLIRHLLALDDHNAYRLYLSAPLSSGLLPLTARTSTRLIRLPRLWTHVGLGSEMIRAAPEPRVAGGVSARVVPAGGEQGDARHRHRGAAR